jgi:hypothetical protein
LIVNKYSKFQMDTFDSFWEMDSDKTLNQPRRWCRSDDNSSTFFLWKVELKIRLKRYVSFRSNNYQLETQYTCKKCWPQSVDKRRQLHLAFYLSYSPFLTWNELKIQFLNNYDRHARWSCLLLSTDWGQHFLQVYWVSSW